MAGEGQESSTSATEQDRRENKERRRRERRERRARRQRQRQNDMLHQMDGGHMYDAGCHGYVMDLPDILNSHVPPPPYTTLPGRGHGQVSHVSPTRQNSRSGTWRAAFPGFSRHRWFFFIFGWENVDKEICEAGFSEWKLGHDILSYCAGRLKLIENSLEGNRKEITWQSSLVYCCDTFLFWN